MPTDTIITATLALLTPEMRWQIKCDPDGRVTVHLFKTWIELDWTGVWPPYDRPQQWVTVRADNLGTAICLAFIEWSAQKAHAQGEADAGSLTVIAESVEYTEEEWQRLLTCVKAQGAG